MLVATDTHKDYYSHQMKNSYTKCAYCLECGQDIAYKVGQTSSIGRHLAKKHPKDPKSKKQKTRHQRKRAHTGLPDYSSSDSNSSDYSDSSLPMISKEDEKRLMSLLSVWLAGSHRPFSLVEDPGFLKLMKFVPTDLGGVRLKVPSRTAVSRAVEKQADQLRALLKMIIKEGCDCYSLTTDAWTDRTMRSSMAVTLHYIDENFSMKDYVLEVEAFDGKHTAQAIRTQLDAALDKWGLDKKKCVKLVRDGATNVTKGAEQLGVPHMSCLAHSLHLVVAGAMVRKKGKLADSNIDSILHVEAEEQRIAREVQEAVDAISVATITARREGECAGRIDATEATSSAPPVPTQATAALEFGTSIRSGDTLPENGEAVDAPSPIDANMTASWNDVRERACEEVQDHLDNAEVTESDLAALTYTRDTVQVFRSLAVYFRKSAKAKNRLLHIRNKYQPSLKSYFSLDCPTRWNSSLAMLARFSYLRPTVKEFFAYLDTKAGIDEFGKTNLRRPQDEHWFVLRCLMKLLEQFAAVTVLTSGGQYPTQAIALPALRHIRNVLRRLDIFDHEASKVKNYIFTKETLTKMHQVRRTILTLFLQRFSTYGDDLLWTSYLDPRLTDMQHTQLDEILAAQDTLVAAAMEVAAVAPPARTPSREVLVEEPVPELTTPVKVSRTAKAGIFGSRGTLTASPSPQSRRSPTDLRQTCAEKFKAYLAAAKTVPVDANPLEWRANEKNFPNIAKLARRWLGCIATSVPSERAFSTAGRVVSVYRCSLKPAIVRDAVFITSLFKPKRAKDKTTQ